MNFMSNTVSLVISRSFHTSCSASASIFMKAQKKMDPEMARIREERKRKKLEREIRQMKKHSKKPKPVEEMTIDVISAKNIQERYREPIDTPQEVLEERILVKKAYARSRNQLTILDDHWIRTALARQESALEMLKELRPELYAEAVKPCENFITLTLNGPSLTPPISDYQSPDGEYIDKTKTWV